MNKYQEALERQKSNVKKLRDKEFVEYRDDFATLQELVDKEIPKKVKIINHSKLSHSYATHCPNCNERVVWEDKRCLDCGQVLDWEA